MSIQPTEYLLLGIAGFVLAGFLTWPVRKVAIAIGAMDKPNLERKSQKEPVPFLFLDLGRGTGVVFTTLALTLCLVVMRVAAYNIMKEKRCEEVNMIHDDEVAINFLTYEYKIERRCLYFSKDVET